MSIWHVSLYGVSDRDIVRKVYDDFVNVSIMIDFQPSHAYGLLSFDTVQGNCHYAINSETSLPAAL